MGNSTRNAHSNTAQKVDMKVGQWIFCLKQKHDHSEIHDDYHIVFKRFLHDYSLDRLQTKTGLNFIELKILIREKCLKN